MRNQAGFVRCTNKHTERKKSSSVTSKYATRNKGAPSLKKGYTHMPRERARYCVHTDKFLPSIYVNNTADYEQFNLEFPISEGQHDFMIKFRDETLY